MKLRCDHPGIGLAHKKQKRYRCRGKALWRPRQRFSDMSTAKEVQGWLATTRSQERGRGHIHCERKFSLVLSHSAVVLSNALTLWIFMGDRNLISPCRCWTCHGIAFLDCLTSRAWACDLGLTNDNFSFRLWIWHMLGRAVGLWAISPGAIVVLQEDGIPEAVGAAGR